MTEFTAEDYVQSLDKVISKHEALFFLVPDDDEEVRWEIRREIAILTSLRLQILDHFNLEEAVIH